MNEQEFHPGSVPVAVVARNIDSDFCCCCGPIVTV